MQDKELSFVIPTYRPRDVRETIEQYDQHFWRNGHSVPIVAFDDLRLANQEKYFPSGRRREPTTSSTTWGHRERNELLGGAAAFLFPIEWPEPFGLVRIESPAWDELPGRLPGPDRRSVKSVSGPRS